MPGAVSRSLSGRCGGERWRCFHEVAAFGQDALEVTRGGVDGQRPGIALAGDPVLHHGEHLTGCLAARRAVFDLPGEGRHVRKGRLFAQEAGQFDVRVFAFLDLAVELEEILVVVNDRGIALLDAEGAAGAASSANAASVTPDFRRGRADQRALRVPSLSSLRPRSRARAGRAGNPRPRWRRRARCRCPAWQWGSSARRSGGLPRSPAGRICSGQDVGLRQPFREEAHVQEQQSGPPFHRRPPAATAFNSTR